MLGKVCAFGDLPSDSRGQWVISESLASYLQSHWRVAGLLTVAPSVCTELHRPCLFSLDEGLMEGLMVSLEMPEAIGRVR